jgi:hypothetical protein
MEVIGADGSSFKLEKVIELKNRVLHEAFEKRAADNKLTGEWIVYVCHQAKSITYAVARMTPAINSSTTGSWNTVCGTSPSCRHGYKIKRNFVWAGEQGSGRELRCLEPGA